MTRYDRGLRRWRFPALALAAAAVVLVLVGAGTVDVGLLGLLPPLALVATMLAWPYPGAELIDRIRQRRVRPRPGATVSPPRRQALRLRRGGRLISSSLGGRAPPLSLGCA